MQGNIMGDFKRHSLGLALGVTLCGTQPAFALPLEGLFTIDPTVQTGGYYTDPDGPGGNPGYYYTPPIFTDNYVSGSFFIMNTDVNAPLVDPLTGKMIGPDAAIALIGGDAFSRPLQTGTDGGIIAGTYQNFVPTPDEPHVLGTAATNCAGDPITVFNAGGHYCSSGPAAEAGILAPFPFFSGNTYTGTNPVSYVTGNSNGVPTFDYDPVTGKFTVDLSSWTVLWNGTVFDQGPAGVGTNGTNLVNFTDSVDAQFDPVTRRYSITWGSQITAGAFAGKIGYWYIKGTYEGDTVIPPVPVPAAAWLFGSGLLGLVGLARRKSKSAS
jgi:hypothetical protein